VGNAFNITDRAAADDRSLPGKGRRSCSHSLSFVGLFMHRLGNKVMKSIVAPREDSSKNRVVSIVSHVSIVFQPRSRLGYLFLSARDRPSINFLNKLTPAVFKLRRQTIMDSSEPQKCYQTWISGSRHESFTSCETVSLR
jgi:hypothetical protein